MYSRHGFISKENEYMTRIKVAIKVESMSSVVVILPKIVTIIPNKVIIIYKHGVKTEVEQVFAQLKKKRV